MGTTIHKPEELKAQFHIQPIVVRQRRRHSRDRRERRAGSAVTGLPSTSRRTAPPQSRTRKPSSGVRKPREFRSSRRRRYSASV